MAGAAAGGGASQSASPLAGEAASAVGGEASGTAAGDSAGEKPASAVKEKERPPAPSTWRPSRRPGRPKGPDRIPLSVRILAEHDARLTQEVERQQLSPQFIVDAALSDYFAKLDRRRGHGVSASENASGNDSGNAGNEAR